MSSETLNLLHFNDVYRVTKQKVEGGTIDVSQFARLVDDLRDQDTLLLFSGDLFSPSVESSVTRGSELYPSVNDNKITMGFDPANTQSLQATWCLS
jgi:5'-nucleotidase